ncbi:U6 snRNA-associated [Pelomyxa schiedti]|nr:U6 snRNA-associated [Pelomyxa schiedti]
MLFYSFFRTLISEEIIVELKNDLAIRGVLHSVDQYLNLKLRDISVVNSNKFPHLMSVQNCFIRGSVVRYVVIPANRVDTHLLQDSTRMESRENRQKS